jgi:hypothetical protein
LLMGFWEFFLNCLFNLIQFNLSIFEYLACVNFDKIND